MERTLSALFCCVKDIGFKEAVCQGDKPLVRNTDDDEFDGRSPFRIARKGTQNENKRKSKTTHTLKPDRFFWLYKSLFYSPPPHTHTLLIWFFFLSFFLFFFFFFIYLFFKSMCHLKDSGQIASVSNLREAVRVLGKVWGWFMNCFICSRW